eukprot:CAMPEP_0196570618 /NCGR_PEP_ID=MMETSP1081-20130531/756_1 /TAXON_ID=36882 /ORGANISM="Pyramimonas amylifera, Strain CCMP720" /LENGTH=192 /DNA_ID=CAMNT_0041887159 /DNA_START=63 /DNA_END=641 /DNA_ORIENTATION=-
MIGNKTIAFHETCKLTSELSQVRRTQTASRAKHYSRSPQHSFRNMVRCSLRNSNHSFGFVSSSYQSLTKRSSSSTIVRAGAIEQLTAEELEVAIQERTVPLIIDFYATWCGPCVLLAQELEKVATLLKDEVRIVKVDTDSEPVLASQLQIQGLPTIVFVGLDKSKPALRTEGLLPAETIISIIKDLGQDKEI